MKRIGFIGAGNMAGAIVKGLLRTGKWSPDDIAASDAADTQLRRLKKLYKIETTRDNRAVVRGAKTIVIAEEGDESVKDYAEHVFYVPETPTLLMPLLTTVPLQIFAAELAGAKGYDVDQPRNLAKSVTVE